MDISKSFLLDRFKQQPEKYWQVELFNEKGFTRLQCKKCDKFFWSLDQNKQICSDSSCTPYSFLNSPITKKKLNYVEMWKAFENYFKKQDHTAISRYPVIDRVRPDLYFTIASIQDFQRIDKSGNIFFVYPANPLIIPQICLRFGDIQSVGVSGRHLTSFCMSGQHAFNIKNKGYFKNECIRYNFDFLTKELGIPEEELVYIEDLWHMPDFSAFGPCLETFSKGCELVNSVFMQFQATQGTNFKELPMKVIDVGWGHERLTWFSNGTPTIYESTFGPIVNLLKKKASIKISEDLLAEITSAVSSLDFDKEGKNIEKVYKKIGISDNILNKQLYPLQAVYSICDHLRTILFAISDGGIPSNVGGGYNLRVLLRRVFNFEDKYKFNFDLMAIAESHASFLKKMYPELKGSLETVKKVLEIERSKYNSTKEASKKTVERMISRNESFNAEKLITLYESQGIQPEYIQQFKNIKIPEDFYERITSKHVRTENPIRRDKEEIYFKVQPTKLNYYETPAELEFDANIIKIINKCVVLEKTLFYPGGGGQENDLGRIGDSRVLSVEKKGDVVMHLVDNPTFNEGDLVHCVIDKERRLQLMQHHTGTHIINAAARHILGSHINQAGAHKSIEKAHLDITHYQNISNEELTKIEEFANDIIKRGIKTRINVYPREVAEKRFGLKIYQGGAIEGKKIRIVEIPKIDVEACSGTHLPSTKDVKAIKILKAFKIQDGIVRIEFVAGSRALNEASKEKELLKRLSLKLKVSPQEIPERTKELFEIWKEVKKGKEFSGFKIKKKTLGNDRELISITASILKTQTEHLEKTIDRFLKEIEESKKV